jgi:hypothetical protein
MDLESIGTANIAEKAGDKSFYTLQYTSKVGLWSESELIINPFQSLMSLQFRKMLREFALFSERNFRYEPHL